MGADRNVALVTGGSRGIGVAIVQRLARMGYHVVFTYVSDEAAARKVLAGIQASGGSAEIVRCELASIDDIGATVRHAAGLGRLAAVVNNAAIWNFEPLAEVTEESFARTININLRGPLFLSQQVSPVLADNGRLVFVSSIAERIASPHYLTYAASKAALRALARGLAVSLGPRGITVNVVSPGAVQTDLSVLHEESEPEAIRAAVAQTALARIGQPEDIANAVAMLVGPDGNWVTGQVIECTGGLML